MAEGFENLKCWQECFELKQFIRNTILPKLPKSERFDLHLQILRAARSATANVAEGYGRQPYKDNVRFLIHARGSLTEFLDHGIEAMACAYIDQDELEHLRTKIATCTRLINGYIKYLRKESNRDQVLGTGNCGGQEIKIDSMILKDWILESFI